jgi:hypothetical protein
MRLSLFIPLTISALLLPVVVQAEQLQPGLWEISSPRMQVDGQQMPGMEQMQEQLKNLPPEQRQMMQQMMAKQGVQLGEQGIRICLSEAQVKANDLPVQQQAGCQQETIERTASLWKFRYRCPDSEGEGETHFASATAFTTEMRSRSSANGKPQNSTLQSQGRWLSADCAGLPSR